MGTAGYEIAVPTGYTSRVTVSASPEEVKAAAHEWGKDLGWPQVSDAKGPLVFKLTGSPLYWGGFELEVDASRGTHGRTYCNSWLHDKSARSPGPTTCNESPRPSPTECAPS